MPTAVTQQLTQPAAQQQFGNPAATGNATPNAQGATDAAKLIQGLLTTPRPGGLAGLGAGAGAAGNQTIGGGIAGVASTVKSGAGIKIYNDQEEYKKWEFVYDPTKEQGNAGVIPQGPPPPGTPVGASPAGNSAGVFGPQPAPTVPPK